VAKEGFNPPPPRKIREKKGKKKLRNDWLSTVAWGAPSAQERGKWAGKKKGLDLSREGKNRKEGNGGALLFPSTPYSPEKGGGSKDKLP